MSHVLPSIKPPFELLEKPKGQETLVKVVGIKQMEMTTKILSRYKRTIFASHLKQSGSQLTPISVSINKGLKPVISF